ncbi:TPA: hypothetical protein EYP45_00320 [Candidatus Peregrinibacteria bacterium]|nr:hypothetical protein [Candidatus Peregrinibacteria bacterium]HIQ57134.1 hypothetical protein [Candidatus Gracilibacteria bacterium]
MYSQLECRLLFFNSPTHVPAGNNSNKAIERAFAQKITLEIKDVLLDSSDKYTKLKSAVLEDAETSNNITFDEGVPFYNFGAVAGADLDCIYTNK